MASNHSIRRYRYWYARLLHLYPRQYYERFAEGMEQTFNDLLREREEEERGLFAFALWVFIETFAGIIKENTASFMNIVRFALATAFILLLPLLAMRLTDEVVWTLSDFAFAGALLFGTGLTYDLITRKAGNCAYRIAAGVALATALLLVWANGAVGLIGSEDNPANQMYFGVLGIGIVGAVVARLHPHGMARSLFATAFAQALVAVIALIAGEHKGPDSSVAEILNVNGFFVVLWLISALLFRRAARQQSPAGTAP